MKRLLAGIAIALPVAFLAGSVSVQADTKYVKLRAVNKANMNVQVYVVDHVTNKTEENKQEVTNGGVVVTKAALNAKGYVDFTFSVLYRDTKNGSYYRCLDVSTSADGKSELSYDLTTDSGRKCAG